MIDILIFILAPFLSLFFYFSDKLYIHSTNDLYLSIFSLILDIIIYSILSLFFIKKISNKNIKKFIIILFFCYIFIHILLNILIFAISIGTPVN